MTTNLRAAVLPLQRYELTKLFIDYLAGMLAPGILIGRGTAPPAGGFPKGAPQGGAFKPYVVLKTGVAISPAPGERDALAANMTSWQVTYQLTTHHDAESKVDESADAVRQAAVGLRRQTAAIELNGVVWTLQSVFVPRMGATTPYRGSEPVHWQCTDDVSLHLSRDQRR